MAGNTPEDKDVFCGDNITPKTTSFIPKSLPWDSGVVLGGLTRVDIVLPDGRISELRNLFWNDLCSEYDAENFCVYLDRTGFEYTPEFRAFERVWRRDEYNHYAGFRTLYSMLYGETEDRVVQEVTEREVDFSPIEGFLRDEFMTTLLVGYDEIATTRSYAMDYELYGSFGDPRFLSWIKQVTRDEAFHFNNCMEVIRLRHPNRIREIPGLVQQFVEWDLSGHEYKGTFVLDHKGYYFTPKFLNDCGVAITSYYKKRGLL